MLITLFCVIIGLILTAVGGSLSIIHLCVETEFHRRYNAVFIAGMTLLCYGLQKVPALIGV